MATTAMSPMLARRWATTAQAISTTASSSAWAHGPAGAMATVGEATASMVMVEDATTVELAALPTVGDRAEEETAQTVGVLMPADRVRVRTIVNRPPRPRVAAR